MTKATIAAGTLITALVVIVLALAVRNFAPDQGGERDAAAQTPITPSPATPAAPETYQGFLYGRVIDVDGARYEGRLRWGGDQEAFWGDPFNGTKDENPWAVHVAQPEDRRGIEIFGFRLGGEADRNKLRRLFMARFGDIARIEAHVRDVQVTLKSGNVVKLDRFASGDIDDGVRVWDGQRGVLDLDSRRVRTIEFLSTAPLAAIPARLHGTVRTQQGEFTGFIQWDQEDSVGTDTLDGRTADGEQRLRYDTIRSIARNSRDSARVTLLNGHELVMSKNRDVSSGNRGINVEDPRYGRVQISWDAFERVDFSPGGSGPAFSDFPPGRALTGTVRLRDGRGLAGRLVYDFDESETTETLDAAVPGVDYNIPFSLIASIQVHGREGRTGGRATVVLHDGKELQLERTGDLAEGNAGLLIFVDGRERPEFVTWADVERLDLKRPPDEQILLTR